MLDKIYPLGVYVICDEAGIVHCRASDMEKVMSSGFFKTGSNSNTPKMMHRGYSIDLLVPDRFAFASAFPDLTIDRASIEEYMTLTLKGESL